MNMNDNQRAPDQTPKKTRADKRRERKLTQAQQIALEKQLVKESKILPRTRYTPKGYLGRVLAVLLAFLFGMLVVIGGILGGGYYLAITPSRNLLNFLNLNADEFLTEEYLDKSVIDIVSDVRDDLNSLSDPNNLSFDTISKYTPLADTYLDSMLEQLSGLGIDLDKETLSSTSFASLGTYLGKDVVPNIELGKVLTATLADGESLDPLLMAIAYGEEGVDYTLNENGEVEMIGDAKPTTVGDLQTDAMSIIQSVPLESVLQADAGSAALILALCYGEEGVDYTVNESGEIEMIGDAKPNTLGDIMNHPDKIISGITIDAVISIGEDSNEALLYLAYGTEGVNFEFRDGKVVMLEDPLTGKPYPKRTLDDITEQDLLNNATIGSIITVDENSSGILKAIKDWTLGDLTDSARIESLKLSQLISIDENSASILQAMADWSIAELTDQSSIDSLTLGEVITIGEDSAQLLLSLKDTAIGDLSPAISDLRLRDILGDAVNDNNILRALKNSTLDTLSEDVSNLTVADVFGDELYSYLDLSTSQTYEELIKNYNPEKNPDGSDQLEGSAARPEALTLGESQIVVESRVLQNASTPVYSGYFLSTDSTWAPISNLVDEADVYRRAETTTDEDGTEQTTYHYYTNVEYALTPADPLWKIVDYGQGGALSDLPEGDKVVTEAGLGDLEPENTKSTATPYKDADGNACYYVTTRVHLRNGEPETETVAYPLCVDEGGVYYYRYVLDEEQTDDGNGGTTVTYKSYSRLERVDLEQVIPSYSLAGESYVPEDGCITIGEGEDARTYRIRTETTTDEETGVSSTEYYIVMEDEVFLQYYMLNEGGESCTFVSESKTKLIWTIGTDADGDGAIDEDSETINADRYLSGVWYLLFGGEETNEQGEIVGIVDKTDSPVLGIAGDITNVAVKINSITLWQMWFHEFIDENPWTQLPNDDYEIDGVTYTNLNEFTVNGIIGYVQYLIGLVSGG